MYPDSRPTEKSHVHCPGLGWTLDRHSCDDPQRALRPDEELLQVIARVVLPQRGQAVQDSAVGQHLAKKGRSKGLYVGPRRRPSPLNPTPRGPTESRAKHEPSPHRDGGPRVTPGQNVHQWG